MDERIRFGIYQSCGNRGVLYVCLYFGCSGVGGVCGVGGVGGKGGEWVWGMDQGMEGVMLCLCEL